MTTNHAISLQEAIEMTIRYRANQPANLPVCETFDLGAINQLMATQGCSFLRIYYGIKTDMSIHAILVAADADGADILPAAQETSLEDDKIVLLEDGTRCPPDCPPKSKLNS